MISAAVLHSDFVIRHFPGRFYRGFTTLVWPALMTSILAPFFNSSAEGTLMISPLTTGAVVAGAAGLEAAGGAAETGGRVGAAAVTDFNSKSKMRTALPGIVPGFPWTP